MAPLSGALREEIVSIINVIFLLLAKSQHATQQKN